MSETTLDKLRELFQSIDQHTPLVEKRVHDAGMTADPIVLDSVAKYWDALEKLAAE